MNDIADTLARNGPPRNHYGQPLVPPAAGGKPVAFIRCSTLPKKLDDTYNLEQWKRRHLAVGLAARPDILAAVALLTDPHDTHKQQLNRLCDDAMDAAGSNRSANLGTAIHAAIEQHLTGGDTPVMFAEHIEAFTDTLERCGATVDLEHLEQFCVNERYGCAGSFDLRINIGDDWYIADVKTGSVTDNAAKNWAIQLYLYATATSYWDAATEQHTEPEPVRTDRAVIIHVPADNPADTRLHWLDLTAAPEAVEHALWVRSWHNSRKLLTVINDNDAEGPIVADSDVHALRDRAVNSPNVHLIRDWVQQSTDANCTFAMSTGNTTRRRYLISQLAVELADGGGDNEWARGIVALTIGAARAHNNTVTVGEILGTLTLTEAETTLEYATNATAYYDDDDQLVVQVP